MNQVRQANFNASPRAREALGKLVSPSSTVWSLALIAILVVLVRAVVFSFDTTQSHVDYDVDRYLEIARNIVSEKGYTLSTYSDEFYPTAMRGPTVVYFFAAVLWLAGDHPWSIVIAQWLVDVGTAIILFFIALEIFQDRRVAFVTCLLFAFYQPGIIFTFRGWSEPVFTLVLAGFTLSFLYALRRPSTWRYALCGSLLGLAVLARPVMLFYPLAALPLLWWGLKQRSLRVIPKFAIFCLAFAAVLSPWVVRNYLVFNAFIPGSSHRGGPFHEGNYALGEPDYLRHRGSEEATTALRKTLDARFGPVPNQLAEPDYTQTKSPAATYARFRGFTELKMDQLALEEGMKVVREFPGRYAVVSTVRALRVWFHHRFVTYVLTGGRLPQAWFLAAVNFVLLGLAVAAFILYRDLWWQPAVVSLIVLVVYNTALYAATNAVGRYSVPIIPYVMLFSAFTIVHVSSKWGERHGVLT